MKIYFDGLWMAFSRAILVIAICALVVLVGFLLWDAWMNHKGWLMAGIGVFLALVVFFYIREKRQDDADANNGYRRYLDEDERDAMDRHMKQHPELYE